MNSRRLKLSIWLPSASRRRSVYPSLNLTQRGQEVLGADLNFSESRQDVADPTRVDTDAGRRPLHCGISAPSMSALGHSRRTKPSIGFVRCPLRSESRHCLKASPPMPGLAVRPATPDPQRLMPPCGLGIDHRTNYAVAVRFQ